MLLTDSEILEMCAMAREAELELSLFVGPRASWETGATAISGAGKVLGAQHRGQDQLAYALEDVLRGVSLGLRGVLVADAGLLWVIRDLKERGELPEDLVVKVSVQLAADRKSTRLNSSHANISYAVFCLKKKRTTSRRPRRCVVAGTRA